MNLRLGTAIYVYFILDNYVEPSLTTTSTYINITLNGQPAEPFTHRPNNTAGFIYNALVYSAENLGGEQNSVVLSASGEPPSLLLFDYAIYT